MELKRYQAETLATLRRFFEDARVAGPKHAYETIVREPEQAARLGKMGGDYRPLEGLPDVPYVCLRLPTGGGKTILGAHAIAIARDAWVEKDYPLVLWLVPSNTIRLQTAEALKNTRHPYRRVLDEAFSGRVRVFDIADFTQIRPHDIRDNLCVVVGTIQTLRVANTEGRKVYAHNEDMEPHFSGIPLSTPDLERQEGGGIKFSFANLLHLHRPLMIVDEAHNAVTGLTREMQARVNPCAIVEFTATPRVHSNILHNVQAQALKLEEMVKLPIVLKEHDTWQGAVTDAIAQRAALAEIAKSDASYIRPIVLFQAQPKDEEVTVEVLKKHLIEAEQIPETKIAIATGDQRELDGIDLFDPACPIEFVITVEALKEGWDCSFAYVFCSVARIRSAVAVEQLLGRVLRMPYAKRRENQGLNKAYACLSEPSFGEAARALTDKLIAMGFDADEAEDNIEPAQGDFGDGGGLFGAGTRSRPTTAHAVSSSSALEAAVATAGTSVEIRPIDGGRVEIVLAGPVSAAAEATLTAAVGDSERDALREALRRHRASLSPAERGERFVAPRLYAGIQGQLEFADTDIFVEHHDWSLLDKHLALTEAEFAIRETAHGFEIDLDGNRITYRSSGAEDQMLLDVNVEGWTPENLVLWLDRQLRQPDILQAELVRKLRDVIQGLIQNRSMGIAALMRCKFILARKLNEKIDAIRNAEREKVYQQYLFAPDAKVEVSFDNGFEFKDGMYWDQKRYRGRWRPGKHFLGSQNVPAFDGGEDGEEFLCAQMIDSLPKVKYWIRNVARHPNSFWLPTATDRFYPDFVALLEDGRLLVVEYKGAHLADSSDTNEKRTIGRLWETKSEGKGLFAVVEKQVDGKDVRAQLIDKIGA